MARIPLEEQPSNERKKNEQKNNNHISDRNDDRSIVYVLWGFSLTDALDIKAKRFDIGKKDKNAKKSKVDDAKPTNTQGNSTVGKLERKQQKKEDSKLSSESPTTDKRVQKSDQETKDKTYSANKETGKQAKEQVANEDKQSSTGATATATVQMPTPKTEDRPTYAAELQQKAESGDAAAQLDLALCYDFGSGIEKNPVEAHKWFLKAAEQGNGIDVKAKESNGSFD